MYCNYILQLCSKLVLCHWPYSVYLYICTWPLAINFANMPINILSLSLSLILVTYRSRVWCKSNMATKWLGLMNPNGSCTKDKERRDLVKLWYMFDHKLWKCVFSRYTCDVQVLRHSPFFSLQQVCTIWILFTYALLFTHVYCIMYVHFVLWRR